MSERERDGLPPDVAELLEAERAAPAPSGRRDAELWARLEVTLGFLPGGPGPIGGGDGGAGAAGAAAAGGSGGGTAGAASAGAAAAGTVAKIGGGVAVAKWASAAAIATTAAVGGSKVYQDRADRVEASRAALHAPSPPLERMPRPDVTAPVILPAASSGPPRPVTAASTVPPASTTLMPSAAPPATIARERAPAPTRDASSPPVPSVPRHDDGVLGAEHALLEAARAAIARGDADGALAAVERHASDHPLGQLAEEREALYVRALALAGRRIEARTRGEAFLDAYPDSLHRTAVERALAAP